MSSGLPLRVVPALLAVVPVLVHLDARSWEDTWLVAALFLSPAAIGRRDRTRVLVTVLVAVFTVPLLPTVLRVVPFQSERVVALGALFWIAAAGLTSRAPRPTAGHRLLRWTLLVGVLWSCAAALRGFVLAVPPDTGWLPRLLAELPGHVLLPRPQIEPGHAFASLWTRLEWLGALWLGVEVAASDARARRRVASGLAWALVLGFVMLFWDFWNGIDFRGDSFFGRLKQGLPRNNRPLVDNNALGSTLVLALPIVGAEALRSVRESPRALGRLALLGAALPIGAYMLLTARSKAALGAAALALPVWLLLRLGVRRTLLRPLPAVGAIAVAALFVGAQALPASTVESLSQSRYGRDAMRVLRLDVASDYLQANRMAPWLASSRAGLDAPLLGQGLGRLPAVYPRFRVEDLETEFDPTSENAHNQFLQAFAEEGAVGLVLAVLPFGLALAGAVMALRRQRAGDPGEAWLTAAYGASTVGLAINLQVGHSLLESSVAIWAGALFGLAAAGAAGEREPAVASGPTPSRARFVGLCAAAVVLGSLPLLYAERADREDSSHGAYPWLERPDLGSGRDRLVSMDARWFVRWGQGDRMTLSVLDPRPALFEEPLRVRIELDGEVVIRDRALSRPPDRYTPQLPRDLLKLDRPAGIEAGDLVEIRVRSRPIFAVTFFGDSGRDWIGPRVSAPGFIDRR